MSTIVLRCLNAVWLLVAASLVSGQTLQDPALRVTEVVAGLNTPTTMAFIGPSEILVLQKNDGLVQHVIDGVLQPVPALDVAVASASERGLLGIAIHPAFPTAPLVYLYYTESSSGVDTIGSPRLWRIVFIASRGTAAPSSIRPSSSIYRSRLGRITMAASSASAPTANFMR